MEATMHQKIPSVHAKLVETHFSPTRRKRAVNIYSIAGAHTWVGAVFSVVFCLYRMCMAAKQNGTFSLVVNVQILFRNELKYIDIA